MKERACPLCLSKDYTAFKKMPVQGETYIFAKCSVCGFVYIHNPSEDTASHDQPSSQFIPAPHQRHEQIKRLLDQKFSSLEKVDVLEIGSGFGELGKLLHEDKRYQYIGYEPGADRAKLCQSQGLNVTHGFFGEGSLSSKVNVVVLDNVLEHVLQPKELIADAINTLTTGGILVVVVPNFLDMRQYIPKWRKRHYWQPRHHINYFTARHLKTVFEEKGLTFHPFGIGVLSWKHCFSLQLAKVLLDNLGVIRLGLYCYGVKKQVALQSH